VVGAPIRGASLTARPAAGTPTEPAPAEPGAAPLPADRTPPTPGADAALAIGDLSTPDDRLPGDEPLPPTLRRTPAARTPSGDPLPPVTSGTQAAGKAPSEATPSAGPSAPTLASPATTESKTSPATAANPAVPTPGAKSFLPKDLKSDEPLVLTWDQLASFDYTPPAAPAQGSGDAAKDAKAYTEAARKQVPPEIWELEGKLLSVEGFMIPLEYEGEGVKSFLVSRHAMGCCFGVTPRPHEMVECTLAGGKTTPYVGFLSVVATGVFHVRLPSGPQVMLTGIYTMDDPKVVVPRDPR
jgi:hypothetical protein